MSTEGSKTLDGSSTALTPPISPAIRVGDTIYLAGVIAREPDGSAYAPGDPVRQAEKIFEKMTTVLASRGATLQDVVKLVTYFSIPLDRTVSEEYWEVRRKYFGNHAPTSTGVQVASLIESDFVIEIEAIAAVGSSAATAGRDN